MNQKTRQNEQRNGYVENGKISADEEPVINEFEWPKERKSMQMNVAQMWSFLNPFIIGMRSQ